MAAVPEPTQQLEPNPVPPCPECQAVCVVRLPGHSAGSQFRCNRCAYQWYENQKAANRLLGAAEGAQNLWEHQKEPNAIAARERAQERARLEAEKATLAERARKAEERNFLDLLNPGAPLKACHVQPESRGYDAMRAAFVITDGSFSRAGEDEGSKQGPSAPAR